MDTPISTPVTLATDPLSITSPVTTMPAFGNWLKIFVAGLTIGIIAGGVFGLGLGWITATPVASRQAPVAQAAPAEALPQAAPTPLPDVATEKTVADISDYRVMGQPDAPVKIVVFEDPQCPFCKQMSTGAMQQIIMDYVKPGKAALVYRHSLFLGDESFKIAGAMECAGERGKFWEFHDQAYQNQKPENAGLATDAVLQDWAKAAGITDIEGFAACASKNGDRNKLPGTIEKDLTLSHELGVLGTPTIFVNGKRLVGAVPVDFVRNAIESQLANK